MWSRTLFQSREGEKGRGSGLPTSEGAIKGFDVTSYELKVTFTQKGYIKPYVDPENCLDNFRFCAESLYYRSSFQKFDSLCSLRMTRFMVVLNKYKAVRADMSVCNIGGYQPPACILPKGRF